MNNQLRPLTLGEILDRTAELYRNHFLLFAGISAIFAGTMLLVQMLHLGALTLLGYPHIPPHLEWAYAVSLGIEVLAIALVAGLAIAAFNRAVAWIYLGEPATVRTAASSVLSHLRRYLWLMAVTVFRAWAPLYRPLRCVVRDCLRGHAPRISLQSSSCATRFQHEPFDGDRRSRGYPDSDATVSSCDGLWRFHVAALFAGHAGVRGGRSTDRARQSGAVSN